jgi:hypothetical protein
LPFRHAQDQSRIERKLQLHEVPDVLYGAAPRRKSIGPLLQGEQGRRPRDDSMSEIALKSLQDTVDAGMLIEPRRKDRRRGSISDRGL